MIRSGEPLFIPAIAPEKLQAVTLPALQEYIETVGIESVLIVPLIGRSGVVGTISCRAIEAASPSMWRISLF